MAIGDVHRDFGDCFRCKAAITAPPWWVRLDTGKAPMCDGCYPSWRGVAGDWKPRRSPPVKLGDVAAPLFATLQESRSGAA